MTLTRPLLGVLITAAVLATTLTTAPASQADDAGLSPTATAAFNDLAACMQKPKSQLNVLYVARCI